MLKGMGTVPPSSKYDIHNLVRANFHSVSACSCIYSTKCIQSIVSVSCCCHSRNDVVCHVREEKNDRKWTEKMERSHSSEGTKERMFYHDND